MRLTLVTLVALAALVAANAGSSATPVVTLSVTPSAPAPSGNGRTPNGRRTFSVSFRVNVAADQECANLSVSYSYVTLFDGRRSLAPAETNAYETNQPASSASFDVHASAGAADLLSMSAQATCEDADGTVVSESAPIATRVRVAAHSCEQGPLRVLAAKSALRQDLRTPKQRVALRTGHYLWSGYRVWVAKHGRVTYGAAECHGLRAVVSGPATFVPGDYARGSYGSAMQLGFAAAADFRGDQHSGGVETNNAVALPRGKARAASKVARFQVVSYAKTRGRVTRVHVKYGQVYVAGRSATKRVTYGTPLVAHAGQTVFVRCSGRICRPKLG
jgi:hypothetical protein